MIDKRGQPLKQQTYANFKVIPLPFSSPSSGKRQTTPRTNTASRANQPCWPNQIKQKPCKNPKHPQKESISIHTALSCRINQPGQIPPGLQTIFNRRLNQAEDNRASLRTGGRVGKEACLAVDHKGLDATFGTIVADLQPTIQQVIQQIGLLVFQVFHRAAPGGLGRVVSTMGRSFVPALLSPPVRYSHM